MTYSLGAKDLNRRLVIAISAISISTTGISVPEPVVLDLSTRGEHAELYTPGF